MPLNPQQLGELIDRHWGPLLVWVGPRDEAVEDIVQQAFIALASQHPEPDFPVAWLYRTARNLAINERIKRNRRQQRERSVAKHERLATPPRCAAEAQELIEHLSQLPDAAREIVVAKLWGELSFEEIASLTQQSRATVWRHYQQALDQLRTIYGVSCPNHC